MRVDKYLWSTRCYKSRNIASEACRKGQVRINEQLAKPSREVYPGDVITFRKNQVNYRLEVLELPDSRVSAKIVDQYRKDLTPPEEFANGEFAALAQSYYREKGTGRPTKKDRRELDDYIEGEGDAGNEE